MPAVRYDATQKIEHRPRRKAVLATESGRLSDGSLCILTMQAGQSAGHFPEGQPPSLLKQIRLVHLLRSTVDAIHTGAGTVGVHQEKNGLAFDLTLLDGAVRCDGPQVPIVCIRHPEKLPTLWSKGVCGSKFGHYIRGEAAHEGHCAELGLSEDLLERASE